MHIRLQFPTKYTITQDNKDWTLQEVEEERDLGIITTADFKVSRQCTEAASKANKVLGMVSRQFKDLDKEGFLIIYKPLCKTTLRICHTSLITILKKRRQPFGETTRSRLGSQVTGINCQRRWSKQKRFQEQIG